MESYDWMVPIGGVNNASPVVNNMISDMWNLPIIASTQSYNMQSIQSEMPIGTVRGLTQMVDYIETLRSTESTRPRDQEIIISDQTEYNTPPLSPVQSPKKLIKSIDHDCVAIAAKAVQYATKHVNTPPVVRQQTRVQSAPQPSDDRSRPQGVCVMGVYAGKLLIYQKSNLVRDGGFVCTPGGWVQSDETQVEAAVRHMREKVGIELKPRDLRRLASNREGNFTAYLVVFDHLPSVKGPDSNNLREVDREYKFNGLNRADVVHPGIAFAPISSICPWIYHHNLKSNGLFIHFVTVLRRGDIPPAGQAQEVKQVKKTSGNPFADLATHEV